MARLIGPDEASREVKAIVGGIFRSKGGRPAQLWADAAATVPADVLTLDGAAIPQQQPAGNGGRGMAPTVTIDTSSFLTLVQYPPGDVDVIYGTCDGGPAWPMYARTDDRLDALGGRVGTVEGIANAAETPAGAQAKANAAQANAVAASATKVPKTDPRLYARGRRRVGMIGDSITIGVSTYKSPGSLGNVEDAGSPPTWAMLQSARGSWDLIINAGIAGQNSSQILARISDITNSPCDIGVIATCTWNDIGTSMTVAQSVANVTSMLDTLIAANILPVLCTPTPDGTSATSAARKDGAEKRRREFIKLAQTYGIPLIDLFTPIADVTTGNIAAAYLSATNDVHPNEAGQKVLGQAITDVLDRLCLGSTPVGIPYAGATDDLLAGAGFFAADANADGIADGWFTDAAAGVPSIFTDPVLGKMQRITTSGSSRQIFRSGGGTIALVVGHTIELSGYISKNGTSTAQVVLNTTSGARRVVTIAGTGPDVTRAWFRCRWVVPSTPSTTFILAASTGTGTVDFGRLTIRNLTALGIE